MEDNIDYNKISDNFRDELAAASRGEKTSLPFVHNPIPTTPLVNVNQIIQGFVFGGTNAEVVIARVLPELELQTLEHKKLVSPKFDSSQTFLEFIGEHYNDEAVAIGINFAFNLKPVTGINGELDGIFDTRAGKGHDFDGLHGNAVGGEVKKYIKEIKQKNVIVSAANDTICLLVAGIDQHTNRENLSAGIVGTGYNLGFFLDESTAINVESANFTGYPQTDTGKIVDQNSNNPGIQLYDKELAGGSLYKHFNVIHDQLGLESTLLNSTEELVELIDNESSEEAKIAKFLLERSANLVAAHFAGLYEFKKRPEVFEMIMQGSLFWNAKHYKELVEEKMTLLNVPAGAINFRKIDESNILGALKLLTA